MIECTQVANSLGVHDCRRALSLSRFAVGLLVCFVGVVAHAQQVYPQPAGEDEAGFESIFNGNRQGPRLLPPRPRTRRRPAW